MPLNSIELPWPPSDLSPNARVHWAKKAKAAKSYRAAVYILCKQAAIALPETSGKLHLWIDFYATDKRVRDADNLLASAKNLVDGIAEYYKINDNRFIFHPWLKAEVIKGGCVKVRITVGPDHD
jgi:crossover junction endodeoxyribonuclease RusA